VTGEQEIQQFECRWQPTEDFSPIAASTTIGSAQGWFARLALWVRPAQPDVGVPAESVRYEIFGDGAAALAWRHWNAEAIVLEDQTDRRPLVARVLVGDARLLSPKLAMVLCRAGLPEAIGPRPGMVKPGEPLPAIEPRDLLDLVHSTAAELDQVASIEHGLDRLIAAALSESTTALSIQLPQRVIVRPPQVGSQAPLLWGLWRTVFLLLQGSDAWPPGKRGWSFSTYEPPFGDTDIRGLADIVFRAKQVMQPAMNVRKEITVRPHDAREPVAPQSCDILAETLVRALQKLGGEELMHHLDTITRKHSRLDQRTWAAYGSLHGRLTAGHEVTGQLGATQQAPVSGPLIPGAAALGPDHAPERAHAASEPDVLSPTAVVASMEAPETIVEPWLHSASPMAGLAPGTEPPIQEGQSPAMDPSADADLPSWLDPSVSASLGPANRAGQDAPPLFEDDGRHARDTASRPPSEISGQASETLRPTRLTGLLDQLYAGPADLGFKAAQQDLRDARQLPPAADRAAARQSMPERRWYIQSLVSDDPWHIEDTLEAIFRLTVIPDLSAPGVAGELARWTDECWAPVSVIKALIAAASHWDDEAYEAMQEVLKSAIFQRWLTENDIYTEPDAHAAAVPSRDIAAPSRSFAPAHARGGSNPLLRIFGGKLESEVIASILSVICAFLTVLLMLAIMR
jgi:hypothetical protein